MDSTIIPRSCDSKYHISLSETSGGGGGGGTKNIIRKLFNKQSPWTVSSWTLPIHIVDVMHMPFLPLQTYLPKDDNFSRTPGATIAIWRCFQGFRIGPSQVCAEGYSWWFGLVDNPHSAKGSGNKSWKMWCFLLNMQPPNFWTINSMVPIPLIKFHYVIYHFEPVQLVIKSGCIIHFLWRKKSSEPKWTKTC